MSRIGKLPIALPAGVTVDFKDGIVTVKGPKGTLTREIVGNIGIVTEGTNLLVVALDEKSETNAKHGLYRALLNGMVVGVSAGFVKSLEVKGVGWKAAVQGNKLVLNVGFSHPVEVIAPEGIKFECPTLTEVNVSGINKELVGQVAANIRKIRLPEPYHGYGIRYKGEVVEHKEGKTSGKGKK
ncbi:MAG: 50S ribosomal protein L6 [Clostridia bacterium]|nr:50S ribosomal protein L6 [Clostridia bacterium]